MKDKEMIEEMAKDFKSYLPSAWYNDKCVNGEVYSMVKHAYEDNYRKIPKDSVVLLREEYELMENELRDKVYQACKLEKQKTAEKIINYFVAEFPILKTRAIARELAKQFGVEIKE